MLSAPRVLLAQQRALLLTLSPRLLVALWLLESQVIIVYVTLMET